MRYSIVINTGTTKDNAAFLDLQIVTCQIKLLSNAQYL